MNYEENKIDNKCEIPKKPNFVKGFEKMCEELNYVPGTYDPNKEDKILFRRIRKMEL